MVFTLLVLTALYTHTVCAVQKRFYFFGAIARLFLFFFLKIFYLFFRLKFWFLFCYVFQRDTLSLWYKVDSTCLAFTFYLIIFFGNIYLYERYKIKYKIFDVYIKLSNWIVAFVFMLELCKKKFAHPTTVLDQFSVYVFCFLIDLYNILFMRPQRWFYETKIKCFFRTVTLILNCYLYLGWELFFYHICIHVSLCWYFSYIISHYYTIQWYRQKNVFTSFSISVSFDSKYYFFPENFGCTFPTRKNFMFLVFSS